MDRLWAKKPEMRPNIFLGMLAGIFKLFEYKCRISLRECSAVATSLKVSQ
jgi:hypothetical protein